MKKSKSNIFQSIAAGRPGSNKFDLSHERKMAMNMGDLVPIMCQEIVPGDKFRVKSEVMMRLAPMLAPIMHRVNVFTHYFFVPNRLVWNEWQDFITGGKEGDLFPEWPNIQLDGNTREFFQKGMLPDFMGIPPISTLAPTTNLQTISAIPFRAYQLVYNEYFRDQNVTDPIEFSLDSGNVFDAGEVERLTAMRKRAWEKDYFTSALPWAQRGPAVDIPLTGEAEWVYKPYTELRTYPSGNVPVDAPLITAAGALQGDAGVYLQARNIDSISIESAGVTINNLRSAIKVQEWLEKSARGGARYIEQIFSHFGIISSDARLQRPEYLGGAKTPIVISEVLQTMQESAGEGDPLGTMAGHGISIGSSNGFSRSFEEHGYIIGLMSVLPKTAYQQGIPKHFQRQDKFEYLWPSFANLGEQAVLSRELFWNPAAPVASDDIIFGYQSRYAEYKYHPSTVHGDFRDELAYWHMGRIFPARPVLNTAFIESNPTHRIFSVEDEEVEKLYVQVYNKVDAIRPLPYYGTPQL